MANPKEFIQASGQQIYLRELRQYGTYEGLLEGLPTVEWNKQKLDRLIAENQNTLYPSSPYLIQPVEKPIDLDGRTYPFGTPASLPNITCIGRFHSLQPARDKNKDFSELIVIWYQDEFAFPIDPIVMKELQVLNWERFADDFEY